jgi:hypothetical protein
MRVFVYNLVRMVWKFYLTGEEVKRSMEWLIKYLFKVGARVLCHGRRRQVHVARRFSWPDITPKCSDDGHGYAIWLTDQRRMRYPRDGTGQTFYKHNGGFRSLGLCAYHMGDIFEVKGTIERWGPARRSPKCQDRRIILDGARNERRR